MDGGVHAGAGGVVAGVVDVVGGGLDVGDVGQPTNEPRAAAVFPVLQGAGYYVATGVGEDGVEVFHEGLEGLAVGELREPLGLCVGGVDAQETLARPILDLLREGDGGVGDGYESAAHGGHPPNTLSEKVLGVAVQEEAGAGYGAVSGGG